ncbi:hypothetical protein ACA910_016681 [Epithemia clementina (nom. ined.)]
MAEDLQTMVDRMTPEGGCGPQDVMKVAEAIQNRLRVSNLDKHGYVQMAELFMQISVSKQQQQQQLLQQQQQQQRDVNGFSDHHRSRTDSGRTFSNEREYTPSPIQAFRDLVASPSPAVAPSFSSSPPDKNGSVGVQCTCSTESMTSCDDHNNNPAQRQQQQEQNQLPNTSSETNCNGKIRGHETDASGSAQPMSTQMRPRTNGLQHSPMRRPRAPSRSGSGTRTRKFLASPRRAASAPVFDPFPQSHPMKIPSGGGGTDSGSDTSYSVPLAPPPHVPRQPESSFNSIFGTKTPTEPELQTERSTISEVSPKSSRLFASTISSPKRRVDSAQPPASLGRPPSPATTPNSPAPNRPGLQENDFAGLAESPRTRTRSYSPSGRPTPRREDDGAGAATAIPPRNFSPVQIPRVKDEESSTVHTAPEMPDTSFAPLQQTTTEDMRCSPDLFTPPAKDAPVFKTDKYKHRRKGGTPQMHQTHSFSPKSVDESKERSGGINGANTDNEGAAFDAANLTQPSLSHSHVPTNSSMPSTNLEPSVGAFTAALNVNLNTGASFIIGSSARRNRKLLRGRWAGAKPAPIGSSVNRAASAAGPVLPPSKLEIPEEQPGTSSDTEKMDIKLTPMSTTPSPKEAGETNFEFQLGRGGQSRKRRPFVGVTPMTPGTVAGRSMSQEAFAHDYSEMKNKISSLKDDAKSSYLKGDYGTSIQLYTDGIKLLAESPARIQLGDTLAILHSNRAAALLMIGAYEASAFDCNEGLAHVTNNREQFCSEGGPPLKVKLFTRLGRARLKHGNFEEACKNFDDAIAKAKHAINCSARDDSSADHLEFKPLLEQMIAKAEIGKSDAERLHDEMQKVERAAEISPQNTAQGRRGFAEALNNVKTALSIASGSLILHQTKLWILGRMKRWREVALNCERLAASNSRMGGIFKGDLEGQCPFPFSSAPQHLSPDFFGESSEEDPESAELKLNSKAAAEAVFWLPSCIVRIYLRSLRLEERYPAADACLVALESFLSNGNRNFNSQELLSEFAWLDDERNKLNRTKIGREKGDELFRGGDFELAAAQYANCLNIDGEGSLDGLDGSNAGGRLHGVLHCNRAACLMAMKRHRDALEECSAALRIHARYMKAMLRRARCYTRLCRYQEAISEYKRWLDLVEEAKQAASQGSAGFVTPCLFDGPKDVKPEHVRDVSGELDAVYVAKRKLETAAREENARR